jgi:hypothetical protein
MERVRAELRDSPPQRLDLARRTRICNSRIEFVELELPGVKIGRHRVRPPYELAAVILGLAAGFAIERREGRTP